MRRTDTGRWKKRREEPGGVSRPSDCYSANQATRCRLFRVAIGVCMLALPGVSSGHGQPSGAPVVKSATAVPARLVSIRSVLDAHADRPLEAVTVRGTVTYIGDFVTLQDQTGAIEVRPLEALVAMLDDEVEVAGIDSIEHGTHTITRARITNLWRSSPPPPLALNPDDAANGDRNGYLVQLQGKLIRVEEQAGLLRLQLEGDHQFFSAFLRTPAASGRDWHTRIAGLRLNSVVRLTGVLSVPQGQYNSADGSFSVLLRSPEDLAEISGPPWATTAHILELIAGLIVIATLIQIAHIRNVERQFTAILAERARIARDIHDTLAQGFAGIALQLEVVKSDLHRDRSSADSHLRTALGMVRHSRAEAHRSISTLRAFARPMRLEEMFREMIAGLADASATVVHLELTNLRQSVPQETAEQVFRICQEAVANGLQHAQARNLWVALSENAGNLALSVRDDGRGFDPLLIDRSATVHFGLIGMEERAAQICGRLNIESNFEGTLVQIIVPMPRREHSAYARLIAVVRSAAWGNVQRKRART